MKQLKQIALGIVATCLLFACKKENTNNPNNSSDSGYKTDNTYQQRKEHSDILALQVADGKVISASGYNSIIRINADGSLDNNFHADASVTSSDIYYSALAIQPDGKILVAANKNPPYTGVGIVRLNADGTKDNSFFTPAIIKSSTNSFATVNDILLLPSGDIVICGEFAYIHDGNYYYNLVRLRPNGTIDDKFVSPLTITATASSLALANDGKVIVSGRFSLALPGKTGYAFIKIDSYHGTVDKDFLLEKQLWATVVNAGGVFYEVGADKIIPQPDGKYLIQGSFTFIGEKSGDEFSYPGLARLNADGSLDNSFKPKEGGAICLLPDGNMLLGKSHPRNAFGDAYSEFFSVMKSDGSVKASFSNLGFDKGNINNILRISDNEFIMGGSFYKGFDTYGIIKVKK